MIKRFPSRNSRSKGIKVKHVLQICLLLGVCFWLIYQVKHSHDKKKEFDEKDAEVASRGQSDHEKPKFGRKDLQPRVDDVAKNEKAGEDEDDETMAEEVINGGENKHAEGVGQEHEVTKHEDEEREDISKQEDEEMDEDETKHEEEVQEEEKKVDESEEDGRGAGDDEIDEHDHDKLEAENVAEDAIDEEKEKAEEDNEKEGEVNKDDGKDVEVDHEASLKDGDHDDGSQNTHDHEAREEHYRADDASSAVTHDALTIESGKEILDSTNGTTDVQEDEIAKNSVTANLNSTSQLDKGDIAANRSLDATVGELKDEKISLPSSDNTTFTMVSDDHQQKSDESAAVNPETGENSTDTTSLANSTSVQNATAGESATNEVSNLPTDDTTTEPQRVDDESDSGDLPTDPQRVNNESVSGKDQSTSTPIISEAEDGKSSNSTIDSDSGIHNQTVDDETTGEEEKAKPDENPESQMENPEENQGGGNAEATHDPIDSSDSSVDQEENAGVLGNENIAAE